MPLRAQLTLGESSAPGDIFDSIPFRGLQLASDEDMLPDSLKGYAPVVRGIARSHAQVNVWQNGHVIYQTYVAPGAFEITDIYPTGGSGDLYVTIKEADGSEQRLVVPFASVPVLQREGHLKYSLTGGEYRGYGHNADGKRFCREPRFMACRRRLRSTAGYSRRRTTARWRRASGKTSVIWGAIAGCYAGARQTDASGL